ncbi:TRAP transporter large permease subunit [candidate division KSB1 bacterium]|nr:TRAP transporter large permease subunit [candidate division KSB1 bacterium]
MQLNEGLDLQVDQSTPENNRFLFHVISFLCLIFFAAMLSIPLVEAAGRKLGGFSISGAGNWVQHCVLWLGLSAGVLTSIQKRHLSIGILKIFEKHVTLTKLFSILCSLNVSILFFLALASMILVRFQMDSPENIAGWLPLWLAQAVMPGAFLLMGWVTISAYTKNLRTRLFILGIAAIVCLIFLTAPDVLKLPLTLTFLVAVIFFALIGMPIYALLGGVGCLLFYAADIPIAALPVETYRIMTQPILPSIPLFALAGTVLAAGGAPKRLVNLILAWTSWLPGGPALATVLGCAVFTAITGASGVTILALGSLLLPVLISANYGEKFSIGLLTSSGSLGLLFPPSLPVILYGVYAHVAIDKLFIAAFVPGILLVVFVNVMSIFKGSKREFKTSFNLKAAVRSVWLAKGDLVFPFLIIFGLFGGFFTLVETAAFTALWAILLETVFHRQLNFKTQIPRTLVEASILSGALLIVLGLASGFLSYMVDMQIPYHATEWVTKYISSKYVFLLVLNIVLLFVGAVMDIYSAIVIVVPLIVPIGLAFGINPVHLGVIFLANLELGYLTPPIGLNLFLASLRFKQPLLNIWKTVLPFLFLFLIWVLLITYLPFLSVGMMEFF